MFFSPHTRCATIGAAFKHLPRPQFVGRRRTTVFWGIINDWVYINPPQKKASPSPHPCLGLRVNTSWLMGLVPRDSAFRIANIWKSLSPALSFFSLSPFKSLFLTPKLAARARQVEPNSFSFQLKAFSLFPFPPSTHAGTHRCPLITKAGCDSRRGEENRGIQTGKPRDV